MIRIFPSTEELNDFAAQKFAGIASQAIEKRGGFTVALAGGSTPRGLYRLLAGDEFRRRADWRKVFFFFGDERNVPPGDEESNFRMARENLFQPLEIPAANIFRWQTEPDSTERVAAGYERAVKAFFETESFPRFDLILLGMGADGHTASLFPFTEALRETDKIAAANYVEKLRTTRLTLTFPVINNARNVIFLVAGEEKAAALHEVLEGDRQPEKFPSQSVAPHDGELFWLVDEKAASLLNQK